MGLFAWGLAMLFAAATLSSGVYVFRVIRIGQLGLWLMALLVVGFFLSLFTSVWNEVSHGWMLGVFVIAGLLSSAVVAWRERFSAWRKLNRAIAGVVYLLGVFV